MTDNHPLVSICIPTYNRASMVGKAIGSALTQTYRNIEVIVVDNASTDATGEKVAEFNDSRLRYVRNLENLGLFGNFNRCIELARGEFIHILHSDDYIDPEFTATCIRFFMDHPTVGLTFTSARYISGQAEETVCYSEHDEVIPAPEGFIRILSGRQFIVCPSVMVRRGVYDKVGRYSLEYPYSADYYQWLTITRNYDIGYVHDAILSYVQGEHSETYRLLFNNPDGYTDTLNIYSRVIRDLGPERGQFAGALNAAIRRYIRDCLYAGATRSDLMKDAGPSFFTNISLTAWALHTPGGITDSMKKYLYRALISVTGVIIEISLFRRIIRHLLAGSANRY